MPALSLPRRARHARQAAGSRGGAARRGRAAPRRWPRPPRRPGSSGPQAHLVAIRVGEDREPAEVAGQVGGRDEPLAAELLGPVEVAVQVVDLHVDLDARALTRRLNWPDAAADRALAALGVDYGVAAHVRVGRRLPAEQFGVELACPLRVRADDLKPCHWLSHHAFPFMRFMFVETNVSL